VSCWLQSRIEAAEKSRQTIVNECLSLDQQLSASESSRAALREQFEQLGEEVKGYQKTIREHVSLAASTKVRHLDRHFVPLFVETCSTYSCILELMSNFTVHAVFFSCCGIDKVRDIGCFITATDLWTLLSKDFLIFTCHLYCQMENVTITTYCRFVLKLNTYRLWQVSSAMHTTSWRYGDYSSNKMKLPLTTPDGLCVGT